jgi:hypothetical protein
MKKSSNPKSKPTPPEATNSPEPIADNPPLLDPEPNEDLLAGDQFAVTGREDEASSTGHRVEPIFNDEEGNAEKLIEEGLHGYLHRSKKDR